MDLVGNILSPLITEGVGHHLSLDENMNRLKRKCQELDCRKEDVESKLQIELKPGKKVKKEVELWLITARRINADKQSIENQVERRRYLEGSRLGKLVAQKIEEVDEHYQKGSFSNSLVVDAPPRKGAILPITKLAGETTAVRKMEEIWSCLIDNDRVRKIGVYGMGGSGKTTVIKHINNRILEWTDQFARVIWVTVSKAFNRNQLQKHIANAFKVDLKHEDEPMRAAELFDILKEEKKYLLILDDMWEAFDLHDVGIPEPTLDNECKIILTTRSREVCRRMKCQDIRMDLLLEGEAWNLFLDTVGRDLLHNPHLEATMKLVAKECGCLPLAIITIAGSLKGVDEECDWKTALDELRKSTAELTDMGKVFGQLKYSYDRLNCERLKRCLLYCALYPEDHLISRGNLIVHLIAEGIIEGTSRQQEFDKGHSMLNKLENVCLLERVEENFSHKVLKMHDLIKDMALQIMGHRECIVEAGVLLTDLPDEGKWGEDLKMVSLMHNQISNFGGSPRCSKLSTLLLSDSRTLKSILGSFFVHMHGLRVLDVSSTSIEILPDSISDLENLTALLLRDCWRLRHVPSLAKLEALMMLDHRDTDIREVPQGMEKLVKLKFLYLRTKYSMMLPPGILPNLTRLHSLTLWGYSLTLKVEAEEVAPLRKLETLTWKFAYLHDLGIYVKSLQGPGPSKYNLQVRGYSNNIDFDDGRGTEGKSRHVIIMGCRGGEDLFVLPSNVQYLCIVGCVDLSCLRDISTSSSSSGIPLQSVEVLQLEDLRNLQVLIRGGGASPPLPGTFSCLQVLKIFSCPKLKMLFTLGLVPHLQNLVEISVNQCDGLEAIIAAAAEEGMGETSHHPIVDIPITLPKLKKLSLEILPKLKSIVCSRRMMVCDSLQSIYIWGCRKLKRLPLSLPMLNGQLCPHPSLQSIKVKDGEWWESLEWDQPNAKDFLQPLLQVYSPSNGRRMVGIAGVGPAQRQGLSLINEMPEHWTYKQKAKLIRNKFLGKINQIPPGT